MAPPLPADTWLLANVLPVTLNGPELNIAPPFAPSAALLAMLLVNVESITVRVRPGLYMAQPAQASSALQDLFADPPVKVRFFTVRFLRYVWSRIRTVEPLKVTRPGAPPSMVMVLIAPLVLGNVIEDVTGMTTGLAPQLNVTSSGSNVEFSAEFSAARVQLAAVPVPTTVCPATACAEVAPPAHTVSASESPITKRIQLCATEKF